MALARRVARDAPVDGCAARTDIAALGARARELVAAGRVPRRLRAPLLAGVAAVAADAPPCTPAAPAPATVSAPPGNRGKAEGHDEPHHDHGHGHGHGHGHDEGD